MLRLKEQLNKTKEYEYQRDKEILDEFNKTLIAIETRKTKPKEINIVPFSPPKPIKFFKRDYNIDDIMKLKTQQMRKKNKEKITKKWLEDTKMKELKKLKRKDKRYAYGYQNNQGEWIWYPVKWSYTETVFFKGYVSNRKYPIEFLKQKFKDNKKWKKVPRAGIILIKDNSSVFLVQSYRDKFGFPKGGVNHNESPINAAMREFKEETGTSIQLTDSDQCIQLKMYQKLYTYFIKHVPSDFKMNTFPKDDVEITSCGWVDIKYLNDTSNELWFKCSKITQKAINKIT